MPGHQACLAIRFVIGIVIILGISLVISFVIILASSFVVILFSYFVIIPAFLAMSFAVILSGNTASTTNTNASDSQLCGASRTHKGIYMYVCLFRLCVCAVLFMSFGNDNFLGLVCILYLLCRGLVFCIWECSRGECPEIVLKDSSQTKFSEGDLRESVHLPLRPFPLNLPINFSCLFGYSLCWGLGVLCFADPARACHVHLSLFACSIKRIGD
jgi:hypothetical protein